MPHVVPRVFLHTPILFTLILSGWLIGCGPLQPSESTPPSHLHQHTHTHPPSVPAAKLDPQQFLGSFDRIEDAQQALQNTHVECQPPCQTDLAMVSLSERQYSDLPPTLAFASGLGFLSSQGVLAALLKVGKPILKWFVVPTVSMLGIWHVLSANPSRPVTRSWASQLRGPLADDEPVSVTEWNVPKRARHEFLPQPPWKGRLPNPSTLYVKYMSQLHRLAAVVNESDFGSAKILGTIAPKGGVPVELPLYSFTFGPQDPSAPLMVIVGGIHGVELITSEVVIQLLEKLTHQLSQQGNSTEWLRDLRIVILPMANPWGLYMGERSNGDGIDLMRNAPIDSPQAAPILGGHRISPLMPWYRGPQPRLSSHPTLEEEMAHFAHENQLITRLLLREMTGRPFIIAVDVHSGYGHDDWLWFPYAYSQKPFDHAAEIYRLKELIEQEVPAPYIIEPQMLSYNTHGDLWDWLFLTHQKREPKSMLLPLCIEIGTWRWVEENPSQFSWFGLFNPVLPRHRQEALNRHHHLFDFLINATHTWRDWLPDAGSRQFYRAKAFDLWYPNF